MYYYIVDPQKISQREFERVQNLLYSSLSEYHISGEVMRVTGLRTINQLVENAFAHGAKTLVAVGSDDTLHDVINAVRGREVTIGFIPIFDTEISKLLGVTDIPQADKTIGARRMAELDLGVVNNNYFLSKLSFGLGAEASGRFKIFNFKLIKSLFNLPQIEVKFSANNQYQATISVVGGLIINSLTDGVFNVMLLPKLSKIKTLRYRQQILAGDYDQVPGASVIHVRKIEISNPDG